MKTMTFFLTISIIGLSCLNLEAQNNKLTQLEEKAYMAYINSSVFMWKQIALEADKILSNEKSGIDHKIKAIEFKYGLLYSCLSNKDEETYEKHLDKTLEQLELLLDKNPDSSTLHAITAGIMSVQMGFSPMKGMTLGSQSGIHIGKAISLDSLNAAAWKQHANSKYFTPKMWGGDIQEAIKSYEHAISLFEKENNTKDWIYLDALAWLGVAYEKTGEKEKAKTIYEKALEIEPGFTWVKNNLLPTLLKS